jgi:hypothetical protein
MRIFGLTVTRTKRGEYGEHLCSKCGKTSELPGSIVGCASHEGTYEGYRSGKFTGMTPQERINARNRRTLGITTPPRRRAPMPESKAEDAHAHDWFKVTRIVQRCACGAEREWDGFEWWITASGNSTPPGVTT